MGKAIEPTVWVATKLGRKFMIAEIVLRPDKALIAIAGELYSIQQTGNACLGLFLGFSADPETLAKNLPIGAGDEVLIVPATGGE